MQAVLVFAPSANPTYMPLGIAFLSEYIRVNVPGFDLKPLDLNIHLWNHIAAQNGEFATCRDFMQGKRDDFYNKPLYLAYQQAWKQMSEVIDRFSASAKVYLETDAMDEPLRGMLDYQCSLLLTGDPQFVGFSVMYPAQVIPSLALAKYIGTLELKNRPQIVFGGATISVMDANELLTACDFIDAILMGEGETGLKMLCEGEQFGKIPGLCFRNGSKIVKNNKPDTAGLAHLPLPHFGGFDLNLYFNPEPVVPVLFSRGCKWRKCRFCAHNFSFSGYRKHNVTGFVDYLAQLNRTLGTRHFYFGDQYVDACDMKLLGEEILARRLNIAFHIMGRPTADYTPKILETMSRAGCRWISWGVETGSQRLLDISNKGTTVATVKQVLADTRNAGISNLPMMIYGLPTSTDADLDQTFDFIDEVCDYCDDITSSSFKLFDRTAFAAQPIKYGLKITSPEVIFSRGGTDVHSLRLFFKEIGQDGSYRNPRGHIEVDRWKWRRKMMRFDSVYTELCCEHYLLYAQHHSTPPVNKPIKTAASF